MGENLCQTTCQYAARENIELSVMLLLFAVDAAIKCRLLGLGFARRLFKLERVDESQVDLHGGIKSKKLDFHSI